MKRYIICGGQLTESGGAIYGKKRNVYGGVWDGSAMRGHASFRHADRQLDECDG